MTDILSLFVSNEITYSLIKKIYRLAFIILICSIIYSVLDLTEWYKFLQRVTVSPANTHHYFYRYTLWPVISIVSISLNIIGHILNYKGYSYFTTSIKNHDDNLLHRAFKNIYITYILALFTFLILIINIGYRVLFMNP